MLVPDLTFHVAMAVVDLVVLAFCLSQRTSGRSLTLVGAGIVAAAGAALFLAAGVNAIFGFRIFGVFRWVGHAGAFHLPLLLTAAAVIFRRERGVAVLALGVAALLALSATYAYRVEPYWLEITRHTLTSPRLRGLERPVTILQVADVQTDRFGAYEARVFREIAALKPDLVVFLGDYVQVRDAPSRLRLAEAFNALVRERFRPPPLGAYAVQGDCERWDGWEALFAGTGVQILDNETRDVLLPGTVIRLVGLNLAASRSANAVELARIAGPAEAGALEVYLGHSPDYADQLAGGDQPFLALAGHTHGGQVRIPGLGAPITFSRLPRWTADAFARFGPGILSVSRGVGMERVEAPRVRLFCRPELRLITLVLPGAAGDGAEATGGAVEIAQAGTSALIREGRER